MNWLTNFVKPKLSALVRSRKTVPDNLWQNCPNCGSIIHHKDLYENFHVCNSCDYHFRIPVEKRIEILFGKENFNEIKLAKIEDDPLNFTDVKKYKDRLKEYREKIQRNDAFILGKTQINNNKIIAGFMNFDFMGGSMGRAVGGGIVKGAKEAASEKCPYILFTCSGGARMQEGVISLMQMPRTVAAIPVSYTHLTLPTKRIV